MPCCARTLEETERRRVNRRFGKAAGRGSHETVDRTRATTLAVAAAMPDFIVKQLDQALRWHTALQQLAASGQSHDRSRLPGQTQASNTRCWR